MTLCGSVVVMSSCQEGRVMRFLVINFLLSFKLCNGHYAIFYGYTGWDLPVLGFSWSLRTEPVAAHLAPTQKLNYTNILPSSRWGGRGGEGGDSHRQLRSLRCCLTVYQDDVSTHGVPNCFYEISLR